MSLQLALGSTTFDLIKSDETGVVRVDKGRFVVQLVRNRLQTILGEWKLDPREGWLNLDDFKKQYDLFDIEVRATQIIISTKGVKSLESITLEVTKRKLLLSFTATTIYGEISLTVPWSR